MRIRGIPTLLTIALILISLPTLEATEGYSLEYTPKGTIQFSKGSDTPGYPSSSNMGDKFVGLLGTMELTTNGPPVTLQHLAVLYTNQGTTYFNFNEVPPDPETEPTKYYGFYIETVTYINANATPSYWEPITQRVVFLTNQNPVTVESLKVEFYFVSWESSSAFIPGKEYTLNQGVIGNFNLASSSENNIWNDTDYILLTAPKQTLNPTTNEPDNSVPIATGGTGAPMTSVPYVDANHPYPEEVQYLLSIIGDRSIDLHDAYGTNRAKVATARIDLIKAVSGTNYKVDISFTSQSAFNDKFHLHLDGNLNQYGIPYYLHFKQDIVEPGVNIRWGNIQANTANEKTIEVTGVIQDEAERAPAGTYRDTITVTITPVDTV